MNHALWSRPRIMGIVNINDDSFSGDGTLDISEALLLARQMVADGADLIDIGAESARTNRKAISVAEEIARLLPFIEQWETVWNDLTPRHEAQIFPPLLSVNSWRPEIVEAVLKTGKIDMINDIGGLPDPTNAKLCAEHGAILLIMHTVGLPKIPHFNQAYADVWQAQEEFFDKKIAIAREAGLSDDQIMLDPGIDFAKQREDNLKIYRDLERLHRYGLPVLVPISRKTVIGEALDLPEPALRDAGTIACLARGIHAGAHVFRVHHVKAAVGTTLVLSAIQNQPTKPMKKREQEIKNQIADHLGDSPEAPQFFDLIDRSSAVDLEKLIAEVDDSDYSLGDWIEAFLGFDQWLTKQGFSERGFSDMLGYLHCCQIMIAENVDRPNLQVFVNQVLTEYGFDPATPSQK